VPPAVRDALVLVVCLGLLGTAGWLATGALRAASESPTQLTTAPVVVDDYDQAGSARLTVLEPVTVPSGGGHRQVQAGTQFTTSGGLLSAAMAAPATAAVGATLSCDLRVGVARGKPVIDVVRCEPGHGSPRG
jgi:hypothetical protein